jgi:FtsZ-binding cell division protein ZapB
MAVKELDELKEKCIQAMQDVDNFVSEHYDELCNEIRKQHNVKDDWQVRVVSNCGMVHGCYRHTDKDEWFRVIYNNGFWFDDNFL